MRIVVCGKKDPEINLGAKREIGASAPPTADFQHGGSSMVREGGIAENVAVPATAKRALPCGGRPQIDFRARYC